MNSVTETILRLVPAPESDLWCGITFGGTSGWTRDLYNEFVRTGTLHMVAVSGMNLSMVTALSTKTFLPLFGRRFTTVLNIVFTTGYIALVGLSPSVIRAALMSYITSFALLFGRSRSSIWILLITIFMMLLYDVRLLGDTSFGLSVLATSGIILLAGGHGDNHQTHLSSASKDGIGIDSHKRAKKSSGIIGIIGSKLWKIFGDDLRVTLSAQLFTTPYIFIIFGRLSLVAPLTNILISWTMPILLATGMLAVGLSLIWQPLGYIVAWPSWVLLKYDLWIVHMTASLPWAAVGK